MKLKQTIARILTSGGCVLALLAAPGAGHAQDEASLKIEEITVTAQKREQGLQDVPIAISVVSGNHIADMSIRNLEEISTTTPGFHMLQSPAQSGIYIRSIGSSASNQGFEQSVGLFVDGVYAGRERIFQAPFLDIERIEIIKGPQSVILGKNTTGGAVNITTAKPTDHFEGSVSGLYGEDGQYEATAVLSGPLSDAFAGRMAARVSGMDGYIRNTVSDEDEPNIEDVAVRGILRWRPNSDLIAQLKAEFARSRQDGNALVPSQVTPAQLALARTFDPDIRVDPDTKSKSADSTNIPGNSEYNDLDAYSLTLLLDYSVSDWTLASITSFARLEYEQATDGDHLPVPLAAISLTVGSDFEQYSQELRIASPEGKTFEFASGVHYQYNDTKFLDWIPCVSFASVPGPGLPSSFCAPAQWSQTQDTASAFGHGTWNLTEELRASVGLRYTYEQKEADNVLTVTDLDGVTPNLNPFDLAIAAGVGGWATHTIPLTTRTERSWSPSFNLQYDITPDAMAYASFVRGTKGGGFNPLNGTGSANAWQFGAEKAESFEIGAKTRLFSDRMELNVAAFMTEITDFQVSQFDNVTFSVSNAGSANVDGLEMDFRWLATGRLTLSGTATYLDSRYGTFQNAPCWSGQTSAEGCVGGVQDLSGEPLQYAVDWTATVAADYRWELSSSLLLNLHADLYSSDDRTLAPDNDPRAIQDSYTKLNLRIGLADADGRWEVALIGKNLTDEITKNHENDIIGFPGAFYAHVTRGRSLAVQGTVAF